MEEERLNFVPYVISLRKSLDEEKDEKPSLPIPMIPDEVESSGPDEVIWVLDEEEEETKKEEKGEEKKEVEEKRKNREKRGRTRSRARRKGRNGKRKRRGRNLKIDGKRMEQGGREVRE